MENAYGVMLDYKTEQAMMVMAAALENEGLCNLSGGVCELETCTFHRN